jgi:UDP-N-acetylmuramoyl-L-alanyl-D-glutamate--2,6-diaminopimelate ligase
MQSLTLRALARYRGAQLRGDGDVIVRGVRHDSREVEPGDVFVALRGRTVDGARFIEEAVARGAVAIVTEQPVDVRCPQVIVPDARAALGPLAQHAYGDPSHHLDVVGITGTNGKTTVAWLLERIIGRSGGRASVMGTVSFRTPTAVYPAPYTTPEGDAIARFARESVDAGATHLVMEVSSHGLALRRVDGVRFKVAAFTNLTLDHLDFHGDLDTYAAAKQRLFSELSPRAAVMNIDDPYGSVFARSLPRDVQVLSCSHKGEAHVRATDFRSGRRGLWAIIRTSDARGTRDVELESPLLGLHNLENLLVAFGCGLALGIDANVISMALADAHGAPGRLERIPCPNDITVLVDYAHTPDALERVLLALRSITPGRLMAVFGCGGDRDRSKRPVMGQAAARLADLVVVTSDNPRSEPPRVILDEIVPGIVRTGFRCLDGKSLREASSGFLVVEDRAQAIRQAVLAAMPGDTVLIAGKGHESLQILGTARRRFVDREEAERAIVERGVS